MTNFKDCFGDLTQEDISNLLARQKQKERGFKIE